LRLTIPRETGRYKGKRTIPIEEASMPDITHDTGRVNLGANHWMRSKVTLRENCHIDATTHTETDTDFGGFTGGVQLMYSDANQITIGGSDVHSFGMDGKWIGRNARDAYWGEDADPSQRRRVADFTILHFWDPSIRQSATS
jgi:hypothetical protein